MIPKEQSPKFINIATGSRNGLFTLYAIDENGNVWQYTPAVGWSVLTMQRVARA